MKRHCIYLLIFIMPVLMGSYGLAANSDRSVGNADLERDTGDVNGVVIPETARPAPVKKEKTAKNKQDEKSKQYWRSSGSSKKAKVDRAKANVEAAKQRLADLAEQPRKKKEPFSCREESALCEKRIIPSGAGTDQSRACSPQTKYQARLAELPVQLLIQLSDMISII